MAATKHNYQSVGNFDAIVTIIDSSNQVCKDTVAVDIECVADFSYTYDSTNTVQFTNLSAPIDSLSFVWKANYFGPSDTVTHYTYNNGQAGNLYPILVATLSNGKKCRKEDSISINVCDLQYNMRRDSLWLEIKTLNTKFDSVFWNFGDGFQSSYFKESDRYPNSVITLTLSQAYSYQVDSIYQVSVRTIDEFGNTCRDSLTVNFQPCHAGFSKFLDTANNKVILANSSSETPGTSYFYRFGDGSPGISSSSKNISHTYSAYGTYQVCITVQNFTNGQRCNDTYCDSVGLDSLGNLKSNGFTVEFIDTVIITSVEDMANADAELEGVVVYPNPSNSVFNIDISKVNIQSEAVELELYSTYGILVHKRSLSNSIEKIDLSDYAGGLYFLRLSLGDKVSVEKLIKN